MEYRWKINLTGTLPDGHTPDLTITLVSKNQNQIGFEARWFKDWQSWGLTSSSDYDVLLKGEATVQHLVDQVTDVLTKIHKNIGPKKYKEMWVEHEFPSEQYRELINA
jgi:hypothetical protein